MAFQYFHLIFIIMCIFSCAAKYIPDSEERENLGPPKPRDPSKLQQLGRDDRMGGETYEDDLVDQGEGQDYGDGENDMPAGFEVIDGVVLDTSNVMVQDVNEKYCEYKMYDEETEIGGQVFYRRPRREAGWHFIMFEDPLEESGRGHLILMQKLLGFTVENKKSNAKRELRLYEVFHVDLSNDITEEDNGEGNIDQDNETSGEGGPMPKDDQGTDPNDTAELVSQIEENGKQVEVPAGESSGGGDENQEETTAGGDDDKEEQKDDKKEESDDKDKEDKEESANENNESKTGDSES